MRFRRSVSAKPDNRFRGFAPADLAVFRLPCFFSLSTTPSLSPRPSHPSPFANVGMQLLNAASERRPSPADEKCSHAAAVAPLKSLPFVSSRSWLRLGYWSWAPFRFSASPKTGRQRSARLTTAAPLRVPSFARFMKVTFPLLLPPRVFFFFLD